MPHHLERTLWQVVRAEQFAEARVRQTRDGLDLRILAAGELVWSRVFGAGAEGDCDNAAAALFDDYERDGWRVVHR